MSFNSSKIWGNRVKSSSQSYRFSALYRSTMAPDRKANSRRRGTSLATRTMTSTNMDAVPSTTLTWCVRRLAFRMCIWIALAWERAFTHDESTETRNGAGQWHWQRGHTRPTSRISKRVRLTARRRARPTGRCQTSACTDGKSRHHSPMRYSPRRNTSIVESGADRRHAQGDFHRQYF